MFANKIRSGMGKLISFILLLGMVCSCNFSNRQYTKQLKNLDHLLDKNPEIVLDSLKKIKSNKLNESQLAYYYLLEASAIDKNLIYLTTDSTLKIASEFFKDTKDLYNLARSQYYLGKYEYKKRRKTKKAYELLKEAENNLLASKINDIHLLGLIQYLLGHVQNQQGNYNEAEIFFKKAYNNFIEIQDTISATYALRYTGLIQMNKGNYNEAENILFTSLKIISQIDDQNYKTFLANNVVLLTISQFYFKTKNFQESLKYGKLCLNQYTNQTKNIPTEYIYNILKIFRVQNQIDSAEFYCHKLIETSKIQKNLINQTNGYRILADIAAQKENYKEAFRLKSLSNKLKDSLNLTITNDNILNLERSYEQAENQRLYYKAANIRLKTYTSVAIILLSIFAIGFPLYSYHRKLKQKFAHLSEAVKHTEWGFLVSKEFITENHIDYAELERLFTRLKSQNNLSTEAYNILHEALIQQKAISSGRLFNRLTNFDGSFGSKFQQLFPELSTDELLLATMIHHKWKVSDMTTIFHASVDAIRKRKTRLAHKISHKLHKEVDLDEFLASI